MQIKPLAWAILAGSICASSVAAQEPLSAIDWLSRTPAIILTEPPVTVTATSPDIAVTPLDAPGRDAVGLLPSQTTGLPRSLWQASQSDTLARLISQLPASLTPAMQSLLYTLLLAEANPPGDAGTSDTLLRARIDRLLDLGALEPAAALLERAGPTTPALFSKWFDVTLLMGEEDIACLALTAQPYLAPDYRARIFCTARMGDWAGAVTTLNSAKALGLLGDHEDLLLARFLDPELFEGTPVPPVPADPDPLTFRLYEAIGESLSTAPLPRAFAHADLRSIAGWKAQLEAAERLTRSGAIQSNRLLGIYTARQPAASGMIWDRVDAMQRLDSAIKDQDATRISEALPDSWTAMQAARLEVAFAEQFGATLIGMPLHQEVFDIARTLALLSPDYRRAAQSGARVDFARAVALGVPPAQSSDPQERAIADAFGDARPPLDLTVMLRQNRLGEALLHSIALFSRGANGDTVALTDALATFRKVGLEDVARRAALQVLLLDRDQ